MSSNQTPAQSISAALTRHGVPSDVSVFADLPADAWQVVAVTLPDEFVMAVQDERSRLAANALIRPAREAVADARRRADSSLAQSMAGMTLADKRAAAAQVQAAADALADALMEYGKVVSDEGTNTRRATVVPTGSDFTPYAKDGKVYTRAGLVLRVTLVESTRVDGEIEV